MDEKRNLQDEIAKLRRQLEVQRTARQHIQQQEQQQQQRYPFEEEEEEEDCPEEHWPRRVARASSHSKERPRPRSRSTSAELARSARRAQSTPKQHDHHPKAQPLQHNYSRLEQLYNRVCKANSAGVGK